MIAGSVGRGKDNSRHKQTIDLATPFDVAALEAPILFNISLSPPHPHHHTYSGLVSIPMRLRTSLNCDPPAYTSSAWGFQEVWPCAACAMLGIKARTWAMLSESSPSSVNFASHFLI